MPEPWARVKNPTPLPDKPQARALSRLDQESFAALIRDALPAPTTDDPRDGQRRWRALWTLIAGNQPLRQRTLTVLEEWQQQATAALERHRVGPEDRSAGPQVRGQGGRATAVPRRPPDVAHAAQPTRGRHPASTGERNRLASHDPAAAWRHPGEHTLQCGGRSRRSVRPRPPERPHRAARVRREPRVGRDHGERFTDPTAIAAIDYLVQAIHEHRTHKLQQRLRVSGTDRVTWASLRAVGLDPQRHYTVAGEESRPVIGALVGLGRPVGRGPHAARP